MMKVSSALKSAVLSAVVGAVVVGTASLANATTVTTTFTVQATVPATCTISAGNLNFGSYTGVVANSTSTISVTCTNTTTYNVELSAGSGGSVNTRKMLNGAASLNYALYSDAGMTKNWGVTIGTDAVAGTGSGAAQPLTVYGQVPAGQYPTPGSYSDTITASVVY